MRNGDGDPSGEHREPRGFRVRGVQAGRGQSAKRGSMLFALCPTRLALWAWPYALRPLGSMGVALPSLISFRACRAAATSLF